MTLEEKVKLQGVENQITEMIESDYPYPIFKYTDRGLVFQFDEMTAHGEIEIEVSDGEVYMSTNHEYSRVECKGDTFMESFKEVYEAEMEAEEEYQRYRRGEE